MLGFCEDEGEWAMGLYSQHFNFFATYKLFQRAKVLHYIRLESIARDERLSLFHPFIYKLWRKWSFVNTTPGPNAIKLNVYNLWMFVIAGVFATGKKF
jgi:hypothetical protein